MPKQQYRGELLRTIRHGDPKMHYPGELDGPKVNLEEARLPTEYDESHSATALKLAETQTKLLEALGQLSEAQETIRSLAEALQATEDRETRKAVKIVRMPR